MAARQHRRCVIAGLADAEFYRKAGGAYSWHDAQGGVHHVLDHAAGLELRRFSDRRDIVDGRADKPRRLHRADCLLGASVCGPSREDFIDTGVVDQARTSCREVRIVGQFRLLDNAAQQPPMGIGDQPDDQPTIGGAVGVKRRNARDPVALPVGKAQLGVTFQRLVVDQREHAIHHGDIHMLPLARTFGMK